MFSLLSYMSYLSRWYKWGNQLYFTWVLGPSYLLWWSSFGQPENPIAHKLPQMWIPCPCLFCFALSCGISRESRLHRLSPQVRWWIFFLGGRDLGTYGAKLIFLPVLSARAGKPAGTLGKVLNLSAKQEREARLRDEVHSLTVWLEALLPHPPFFLSLIDCWWLQLLSRRLHSPSSHTDFCCFIKLIWNLLPP